MALDDGKVMIIGGAYGGFNSDVIIYHGSSSTFTVAPDMLFENYGTACSLFYSKKHNSRPVVFVVYGKNAQLFDYTVTDSWEESKVHIFSEGHKILQNLHLTFVLCSASQK